MVGWHYQLNGPEFEQALRDGEGQGSLVCYSPRGCKELDTTEQQQQQGREDPLQENMATHSSIFA